MFHRKNIIIFIAAFLLGACFESSNFQAEMIGLTPGSNTSELNFAWYSNEGSQAFVRIFDEDSKIVATEKGVSGLASKGKFFHKAEVKGLKPNTAYKYSVSGDSISWGDKYNYRTPRPDAFRFAAVGDPQLSNNFLSADKSHIEGWKNTVAEIAACNVDFIAGVGDQVDSGNDENEYANFFAPSELRSIPFAPAMGNHDVSDLFSYHFNLPNSSSGSLEEQGNYWYLYNNVLFVALNTAPWQTSKETAESYIRRFDSTFNAAKSANAGKYKWIIVQHHKSTRSVAMHSISDDMRFYKEAGFEDLMAKHGVNLVLAGHDHVYARSNPINGVIYITLNTSSGIKYYDPVDSIETSSIALYFQNKKPQYAILDVDGNAITAEVYETESDAVVDRFVVSLHKRLKD